MEHLQNNGRQTGLHFILYFSSIAWTCTRGLWWKSHKYARSMYKVFIFSLQSLWDRTNRRINMWHSVNHIKKSFHNFALIFFVSIIIIVTILLLIWEVLSAYTTDLQGKWIKSFLLCSWRMNYLCPFFGVKQFRCEISGKILVGYAFWIGVVDELYQGLTQIFWNIYFYQNVHKHNNKL